MFGLTWRTLGAGLGWQAFVAALIFYCIGRALGERKHRAEGKTLVVQKQSLTGRIGTVLTGHILLSAINGVFGYNVLISLFCMILSLPLMLLGNKVELADHVKSWPRSVVERMRETFSDAKEEVKEKIHDGTDAVKERLHLKKADNAESGGAHVDLAQLKALKEKAEEEAASRMWYEAGRATRKALFFWE